MKIIFIVLIITLTTSMSYSQQRPAISNDRIIYVDSAIYYFNKSKTAVGIDTLIFGKGLEMIDSISTDPASIKRIENASEDFKRLKNVFFYNQIRLSILGTLYNDQEYSKLIEYGKAVINQYDASPNSDDRPLFLLALSTLRVPFRVSDKLDEGVDFYTTKLKLYLQKNDSTAISICYFVHGGFYRTKGLKDLSIYYYKKSIPFLMANDTIAKEIISWTNNVSVVGGLYNDLGDYRNAILYCQTALKYGIKSRGDSSDVSYMYKTIAYAKTLLNDYDGVIDLLNLAIEVEMKLDNDPSSIATCYLVKGIYYLKTNAIDSSEFNLQQCNNLIHKYRLNANVPQGQLIPNYYLALLRIKQSRFSDAENLLKTEIPRLVNLREELINEYKLLVEVYLNLGEVKKANETFILYSTLQEQLKEDERRNRKMSFETEQKITDAENTITDLTTEKKIAALSRNYLMGTAGLLLIIALVIYNRFRTTRRQKVIIEKEKQRSDLLLLNILPEEVAEELKTKGSADAKQFDEVTVMFTDFKGFTQISERLSPTELVNEINTCFKAFDTIVTKHNIEKIKTIGDSYMCAGGLPVPNKTHAFDIVTAALEIQHFMDQYIQEREKAKKEVFEIRIGIHTGTVVAGIVGIKKFAYDIWGDTVNIASRMESSGEAGKVNISGSTYEIIKDKFCCEHRGKIQAKNKGEVDMYFVSRARAEVATWSRPG